MSTSLRCVLLFFVLVAESVTLSPLCWTAYHAFQRDERFSVDPQPPTIDRLFEQRRNAVARLLGPERARKSVIFMCFQDFFNKHLNKDHAWVLAPIVLDGVKKFKSSLLVNRAAAACKLVSDIAFFLSDENWLKDHLNPPPGLPILSFFVNQGYQNEAVSRLLGCPAEINVECFGRFYPSQTRNLATTNYALNHESDSNSDFEENLDRNPKDVNKPPGFWEKRREANLAVRKAAFDTLMTGDHPQPQMVEALKACRHDGENKEAIRKLNHLAFRYDEKDTLWTAFEPNDLPWAKRAVRWKLRSNGLLKEHVIPAYSFDRAVQVLYMYLLAPNGLWSKIDEAYLATAQQVPQLAPIRGIPRCACDSAIEGVTQSIMKEGGVKVRIGRSLLGPKTVPPAGDQKRAAVVYTSFEILEVYEGKTKWPLQLKHEICGNIFRAVKQIRQLFIPPEQQAGCQPKLKGGQTYVLAGYFDFPTIEEGIRQPSGRATTFFMDPCSVIRDEKELEISKTADPALTEWLKKSLICEKRK